MNFRQVHCLRQLLIEACDKHLDGGGTIRVGTFGAGNSICPLVILTGRGTPVPVMSEMASSINSMIDGTVTVNELWSFIYGFDGSPDGSPAPGSKKYPAAFLLGKELRERYCN